MPTPELPTSAISRPGAAIILLDDVGGLAVAAEEEIGVLLLERDKAAIGIDGAPRLGRLRQLARLQGRHDLGERLRRGGLGALDPMELRQSRQVGGRPFGAVGDDDRQQDEAVVLRLAVARLVILDLLPVAEPVGDEDQERLRLGDGVKQRRLPKMAVAQMRLVDEHVRARQRCLDRALEAERESAVRRVIAQEDAQTRFPSPEDE